MSTKVKGRLGPGKTDLEQMMLLNRIVAWAEKGIHYEADQRHAELLCDDLGLTQESKGVVTPGTKQGISEDTGYWTAHRHRGTEHWWHVQLF